VRSRDRAVEDFRNPTPVVGVSPEEAAELIAKPHGFDGLKVDSRPGDLIEPFHKSAAVIDSRDEEGGALAHLEIGRVDEVAELIGPLGHAEEPRPSGTAIAPDSKETHIGLTKARGEAGKLPWTIREFDREVRHHPPFHAGQAITKHGPGGFPFGRNGAVSVHSPPMPVLLDLAYLAAAIATAPVWIWRMSRTGKLRTDWAGRFGRAEALPSSRGRRVLLHAVSVGEVNAIRLLVDRLADGPEGCEVVVATTTDTGTARARELFGARHTVVRYPLDLSAAVGRFLDAIQPDVVGLVELEVWPNFSAACAARRIPVAVVNGRLSERSHRRYRRIRPLVAPSFGRLAAVGAQEESYAKRFQDLGAAEERVTVTGTMKWDTAQIVDAVPGAAELAKAMGIDATRPLIVAGSTAPDEHRLLVEATPPGAQLLCAPRRPEWFEGAAATLVGCAQRSRGDTGSATGRFLLDTIGELRAAYILADVVVIGRTFVPLGGSDMIEPIGLGKATIIGPHVENFADSVAALRQGDGVMECPISATALRDALTTLLNDPGARARLAERGRAVIRSRQGATERSALLLTDLLSPAAPPGSRRLAPDPVAATGAGS